MAHAVPTTNSVEAQANQKSKPLPCSVTSEFHAAITAHATQHKQSVADLVRQAVAKHIAFAGTLIEHAKSTATYANAAERQAFTLKANSVERALTNIMLANVPDSAIRNAVKQLRLLRDDRKAYLESNPNAAAAFKAQLKEFLATPSTGKNGTKEAATE